MDANLLDSTDIESVFDYILWKQNVSELYKNFSLREKLLIIQQSKLCSFFESNVTTEDKLMLYSDYTAHMLISKYIFPVFLFLGLIFNLASAVVFWQRAMRYKHGSTVIFMYSLAMADTIVLIAGIITKWIGTISDSNLQEKSDILCKVITFLSFFSSHFSVWVIVAVSVERYFIACHSKQITATNRLRGVKFSLLALMFVLAGVNLHLFWTAGLVEEIYQCKIIRKCGPTNDYSYFIRNVWSFIDSSVYSFIPTIIIITANSLIIWRIRLSKTTLVNFNLGAGLHEKKRRIKNIKITIMLLALSFTFVVTTFPMSIVMIILSAVPSQIKDLSELARFWLLRTVSDCFMYLNHSSNFVLYILTNKDFRSAITRAMNLVRRKARNVRLSSDDISHKEFDINEFYGSNSSDEVIQLSVIAKQNTDSGEHS